MTLLTTVPRFALVLALATVSAPALADKTLVKVCVLTALSGPAVALLGGVQVGSAQYKTDYPDSAIQVTYRDTQGDPKKAGELAKEAIATEGCHIVGALLSSEALAVANVVRESGKVLYVETVARAPRLPEHPHIFRLSSTDSQEAKGAARFLAEQKKSSVAVLSDESSQRLRDEFGKEAGSVIPGWKGFLDSAQLPDGGATEDKVQGEMERLASKGPQTILVAMRLDGRDGLTKALSKLPPDIRSKAFVLGHYGSPTTVKAAKEAYPTGIIAGTPDSPTWNNGCTGSGCNDTLPAHAQWAAKILNRAGAKTYADYPPYAIQVYVSLQFLDAAAKKVGSADAPAMAKVLGGLSLPSSPLGPISIDEKTRTANRGDFFGSMVGSSGGVQMDPKAFYVRPK